MGELLKGKVAVVTGAGRGIGAATALTLAHAGARVVVTARTADDLEPLVDRIERFGGEGLAVPGDLTREEDVERLKAAVLDRFGSVDILVNNAGLLALGVSLHEGTPENVQEIIDVNLTSYFWVSIFRC